MEKRIEQWAIVPQDQVDGFIEALAGEMQQIQDDQERSLREAKFEQDFPQGFDRLSDEIDAMKQYDLYCGTCGHGNGCEHGVPVSRY